VTGLAALGGWPGVLGPLVSGQSLSSDAARSAMTEILDGAATPAQLAAFAVALRMKGETVEELSGLLDAMVDAAVLVELPEEVVEAAVDVVGTGGDRAHTINVSTLASLVLAGSGVSVCKHGNRAASSTCGSADLLEALGVAIDLGPVGVARCVVEAGIGFCFAPRFHPALRHAGPPRREMGIPTAFNILGPMANPARVRRMVVGLADPAVAERMLGVLALHGASRVMIVHGDDGLDELSTTSTSTVWELDDGETRRWTLEPRDFGLPRAEPSDLRGGVTEVNVSLARRILAGEQGPRRDIVVLNAAAGLLVAGAVSDLTEGVVRACEVLDDGRAAAALDRMIAVSQDAHAKAADAP
jgi:anthranilate phosphoribosyltransferase